MGKARHLARLAAEIGGPVGRAIQKRVTDVDVDVLKVQARMRQWAEDALKKPNPVKYFEEKVGREWWDKQVHMRGGKPVGALDDFDEVLDQTTGRVYQRGVHVDAAGKPVGKLPEDQPGSAARWWASGGSPFTRQEAKIFHGGVRPTGPGDRRRAQGAVTSHDSYYTSIENTIDILHREIRRATTGIRSNYSKAQRRRLGILEQGDTPAVVEARSPSKKLH